MSSAAEVDHSRLTVSTVFEKAYELAHRHEELIEGMPGANRFVSAAIQERLEQLDLIVVMIRERRDEFRSSFAESAMAEETAQHLLRLQKEIELLTVAFYYFANAITTIIEQEPLPHLDKFDAGQIGFVRNRLLEHFRPDENAPFARVSMPLDPTGPMFSKQGRDVGMRSSGGLFDNAEKFAKVTGDLFERAVAAAEREKRGSG